MRKRPLLALVTVGLGLVGLIVIVLGGRDAPRLGAPPAVSAEEVASSKALDHAESEPSAGRREAKSAYEEELADALWVEGRVLYPPGTPADEECWVVADGHKFAHGDDYRVLAEPDGRFRVAFSKKTKEGRLRLEARYLVLNDAVRVDPRTQQSGVSLGPTLGGRIAVRLEPVEGQGIEASEVEAQLHALGGDRDSVGGHATVSGGLEGAMNALSVGSYDVFLSSRRFIDEFQMDVTVAAGETTELTLPLDRGQSASGIVVDEQGNPVAGASLSVTFENAVESDGRSTANVTDEAGRFRFEGINHDDASLVVRRQGYVSAEVELPKPTPDGSVPELRVVLSRGATIRGRVVLPSGDPAPGAWVEALFFDATRPYDQENPRVKTDSGGGFEFTGLTDVPVTLTATVTFEASVDVPDARTGKVRKRTRHTRARGIAENVAPGTSDLVIQIGSGNRLEGVVVDSSGAPVTTFHLRLWSEEGGRAASSSWVLDQDFVDPAGAFTLEGLPSGALKLMARAPGFSDSDQIDLRLPSDASPLRIQIVRGGTLAGFVRAPGGGPVEELEIQLRSDGQWDPISSWMEMPADGSFLVEDVPPGVWFVSAIADGSVESPEVRVLVEPGAVTEGIELRLSGGCVVEGEVFGAGGLVAVNTVVMLVSLETYRLQTTRTDAAGRYRFEGVAPGSGVVSANATTEDAIAVFGEGAEPASAGLLERSQSFELTDGETLHVDLAFQDVDPVCVHGTVTINGTPLAGAKVLARAVDSRSAGTSVLSEEDGSYRLMLSHPGPFSFSVFGWFGWSESRFETVVTIPRVSDWRHDLAFEAGAIEGVVRDATGRPLAGVDVSAMAPQNEDGVPSSSAEATTDEDGRYVCSKLVAGIYTVQADASGLADSGSGSSTGILYGTAARSGIQVTASSRVQGIDFVLMEGGRLGGTIRRNGIPTANGWIEVIDARGEVRTATHPDLTGAFESGGLAPGEVTVFARNGAHQMSRPLSVTVRAGRTTEVQLDLVATGSLVITLRGPDGQPRKGEVHVEGYDSMLHFLADQTWSLERVAQGVVIVRGSLDGVERTATAEIRPGETQHVELTFPE